MYKDDEQISLKDSVETEVDDREIILETNEDIENFNKITKSDFDGMSMEDEDGSIDDDLNGVEDDMDDSDLDSDFDDIIEDDEN